MNFQEFCKSCGKSALTQTNLKKRLTANKRDPIATEEKYGGGGASADAPVLPFR